jgi:hypothetical protein
MAVDQEMAVLHRIESELVTGMDDVVMLKPLLQTLGQPSTAAGIAEAAAREFGSSAFEGVPDSTDLEWLRACAGYLAQRDA